MFSMTKIKAVNGAGKAFYANHLAANDYYSKKEKVVGMWSGSLAFDFDLLCKRVDTETFSLFQQNINPFTGNKLTQRTVSSGVRFFDFQCAAPKSVSIMALFDRRLLEAHDQAVQEAMIELERLAARVRKGDNVRTNNLEMTGKIVYASFRHDASRALDPQVHTHNVVVNVTQDSEGKYKALESVEMCRAIRYAGKVYHNELAKRCREFGYDMVNRRDEKVFQTAADFIEVGELREIELCRGDLIQFNVNLRDKKIYNGNIAQITDDPNKVMMLYSDGTPRELIELPEDYAFFKYGWVTTSHKSQGRTAENVVVAAQALDRKAFYVALSRGRKNMALHCPEKEFLKQQLSFRIGDRTSVHDLLAEGQISVERLLPLSEDAQRRKAETLPDEKYKSVIERTKEFMEQLKQTTAKVWERAKQIAARCSRWAKYGYGPISENTILEMDQERAIALAKAEALAREKQRQAEEKLRKPLSKWHETMAWLADIGNGKNPPKPKPQQTSKPAKPQEAMPSFTFKPSVLRIGKPAEPSTPRKKNSMQEALDFLAQESAKIQAKDAAKKARQERLAAEKAAAEREAAAREETLRLEAEQQAREKIVRERAEQNRREQQEREERERNKKKLRGMDI